MLLPASFKGVEEDYRHLKENVQLWDVSVERQVQIKGPDADKLTQLITCRDLSKAKDHICYYAQIVADKGKILKMKFFHFKRYPFAGHDFLIARSGWSKQGGFEIYVDDDVKGLELYDVLTLEGKDLDVRPGCPNLIERIEGGLLSYGNDMDMNDTPLECGLDAFVSFNPDIEYLGKSILEKQHAEGVNRSLVGLKLQMDKISITKFIPLFRGSKKIGELRSACFSPKFQCCLGIAMVNKSEQDTSQPLQISIEGNQITAEITSLPFTK